MRILIDEYVERYGNKGALTVLYAFKCYYEMPSFRVVVLIRRLFKCKSRLQKVHIWKKLCIKYGIEIGIDAHIGEKLQLEHISGIVIGAGAIIGNNVRLYNNVTLGQKNGEYPNIEDNVIIYPGAKIIGGITIGQNSIIGANAVVLSDIPANAIAVGVPARIITKRGKVHE